MPEPAQVEAHVAVVRLADGGPDTFTNTNPPWIPPEGLRAIFGGFLLGQSVSAANETVDAAFALHSLQSTFPRAGNASEKIVYSVERLADSRAFATRQVRATQGDTCLYVATIGYQRTAAELKGRVLHYGPAMPDMRDADPDDPALRDNEWLFRLGLGNTPQEIKNGPPDPFDWRPISWKKAESPPLFRWQSFVRSPLLTAGSHGVHAAALAFLTDEWLLGLPILADPGMVGKGPGDIVVGSTMNQSARFHAPAARADEWMVCERETSWAGDGRVLVEQRLWDWKTGKLVVSCSQEGLFRLLKHAKM
ncbi:thioesterase-like superfamily-domain-containing protein [Whalleya microplaca]|nr:thioesterase-like superfamily-domain-containing protein [Whalleya microplaca]